MRPTWHVLMGLDRKSGPLLRALLIVLLAHTLIRAYFTWRVGVIAATAESSGSGPNREVSSLYAGHRYFVRWVGLVAFAAVVCHLWSWTRQPVWVPWS